MIATFLRLKALWVNGEIRISDHGYDQIAEDNLFARDIVDGLIDAELLEDYPDYPKGPCVLLLQRDRDAHPIHAVWGIPLGKAGPAVLITAYKPDPARWTDDFRRRTS